MGPSRIVRIAFAALLAVSFSVGTQGQASAHGWNFIFASHDNVAGGVQGHGGMVAQYKHYKGVTTVRVVGCNGCYVSILPDGRTIAYGGTRRILASNTKTCVPPQWSSIHGGYACEAFTSVVSSTFYQYCWTEVQSQIFTSTTNVETSKSWFTRVGNCR